MLRLLLLLLITFPNMYAADAVKPSKTQVYKTVRDVDLKLHIFNPKEHKNSDSKTAIVMFHGGGWQRGHASAYYPHCAYFASRGMVAITVEYSLITDKEKHLPRDCVLDAKSAMRYVRSHAKELGINPKKIAVAGSSAGGQLALICNSETGINDPNDDLSISCKPQAVILHAPVLNTGPEGFSHRWVRKYWKEFCPHHNITKESAPTLILLGDKDTVTPIPIAKAFKKKMDENNVSCELEIFVDGEHRFHIPKMEENYKKCMVLADTFLVKHGFLTGTETISSQKK